MKVASPAEASASRSLSARSTATFTVASRVARVRHILAHDPLLANHPAEHRPAYARRAAQARLAHRLVAIRQVIEHAKLHHLLFGRATRPRRRSRHATQMQSHLPLFGDAVSNRAPEFRAQGQHRAEHFPERRQIIVGDPLAEAHELLVEHGRRIEHADHILGDYRQACGRAGRRQSRSCAAAGKAPAHVHLPLAPCHRARDKKTRYRAAPAELHRRIGISGLRSQVSGLSSQLSALSSQAKLILAYQQFQRIFGNRALLFSAPSAAVLCALCVLRFCQ